MELTKLVMDGLMENRLFYLLCVQIIVSLSANILLGEFSKYLYGRLQNKVQSRL